MEKFKRQLFILILICLVCCFAKTGQAFLYPVGPVFDPLNVSGEAAGTTATTLNKITNLQTTINDKINDAKKALADVIAGVLGGKREPGKVPGARKVKGSEFVDYADETAVKQKIYELFWTYPDIDESDAAEKRTRIISQEKKKGYVEKNAEFHQDNMVEVWAAVRGLEEELVNLRAKTQTLNEQLADDEEAGDSKGLNELWKNTYEAYKTYDSLYMLIEEITAMKAMLMMSKAIRYDAKPIYKEQTSSNLINFEIKTAFASENFFSDPAVEIEGEVVEEEAPKNLFSSAPVTKATNVPFANKDAQLKELEKFEPIYEELQKSLEYHNLMQAFPQYEDLFKRYSQMIKIHEKAKEMLDISDKCAINFLGRYYQNPVKIWTGTDLGEQNNEHSLRAGLSGWAYNGLFVLVKALDGTEEMKSKVQLLAESKYIQTDVDGNQYAKEDAALSAPTLSDGTTAEPTEPETLETDLEGIVINKAPEIELDLDAQEKESEKMAENADSSFSSDEEKEKAEADIRETKQLYWNLGFEAISDLINNSDAWGAIVKKDYPVWHDQKVFYADYIDQKYKNILEYMTNIDLTPEVDDAVASLIEDKAKYGLEKEFEYNNITLIIKNAMMAVQNADIYAQDIDFLKYVNNQKTARDANIKTSFDNITKTIEKYDLMYEEKYNENQKALSLDETVIQKKLLEVDELFFEISDKISLAISKQQSVLEDVYDVGALKALPVVDYDAVFDEKDVVNKQVISSEMYNDGVNLAKTYDNKFLQYYDSIEKSKIALSDTIEKLSKIFEDDYKKAAAGDPNSATEIKDNQSVIDAAKAQVEMHSAELANNMDSSNKIYEDVNSNTINSAQILDFVNMVGDQKTVISEDYNVFSNVNEVFETYKSDVAQNVALIIVNQTELSNIIAYIEENNDRLQNEISSSLGEYREARAEALSYAQSILIDISLLRSKVDSIAVDLKDNYDELADINLSISQQDAFSYIADIDKELSNITIDEQDLVTKTQSALDAKDRDIDIIVASSEARINNIESLNAKAIDNINNYAQNMGNMLGSFVEAEAFADIEQRVLDQIEPTKQMIREIVEKYIDKIYALELNAYHPKNHNEFADLHEELFDEIDDLEIDINTIASDNSILLTLKLYEQAMLRLKLSGTDGERNIVDNEYFVGIMPKARDFRIPAVSPDAFFINPREVVYFDEVDWVNTGAFDNSLSKYKFMTYGGYVPKIWQEMLKDKAFVEKDFDLDGALSKYSNNSVAEIVNIGRYPCLIDFEGQDYLLSIKEASSSQTLMEKIKNKINSASEAAHSYKISFIAEDDDFNYPKCENEQEIIADTDLDTIIGNIGRNDYCRYTYSVKNHIGTIPATFGVEISASDLPEDFGQLSAFLQEQALSTEAAKIMGDTELDSNCVVKTVKETDLKSELAMFLQSSTKFADFAGDLFREVDRKKKENKADDNDAIITFDDYIVENIPFKINQIGDFLRVAEEEAEIRKTVDELSQQIEVVKWGEKNEDGSKKSDGLYDVLYKLGYEISDDVTLSDVTYNEAITILNNEFSLGNKDDYESAFNKLNEAKLIRVDSAEILLSDIDLSLDNDGVPQNVVAKNRKDMYNDVIRALKQDENAVISLSDDPVSKEELEEEIIKEETNREANALYQAEVDKTMQSQIDNFKKPYCPAY